MLCTQLKELCKTVKLPVSGTKGELCMHLMSHDGVTDYGCIQQSYLKAKCKEELLVKSGNNFDQVLRLFHLEFGTGTAKRAATEISVNEDNEEVVKTKGNTKSKDEVHSRQKKYQSHFGSKNHPADVFPLVCDLIIALGKDCRVRSNACR